MVQPIYLKKVIVEWSIEGDWDNEVLQPLLSEKNVVEIYDMSLDMRYGCNRTFIKKKKW